MPTDNPSQAGQPTNIPPEDRLDSWKEIAAYLKRDVTTVQRWEKREGMPVRRHVHDKLGSVYALRSELDAWTRSRNLPVSGEGRASEPQPIAVSPVATAIRPAVQKGRPVAVWLSIAAMVILAAFATARLTRTDYFWLSPLDGAHFSKLTDLGGTEQAAAISRDGRFVAFESDRDGPIDVWVTQIGTGEFHNLTRGRFGDLLNQSVRTLGFSPDGIFVTFWARGGPGYKTRDISVWSVPILGGEPRPYLEGVAEFDWSGDGSQLAYHTPGPGNPTFVKNSDDQSQRPPIFAAAAGLHAHFPLWSPDKAFIYFVEGSVDDAMDVWRIRPAGGSAERITHHNSRVNHPVLLGNRTLLYLASSAMGPGHGCTA